MQKAGEKKTKKGRTTYQLSKKNAGQKNSSAQLWFFQGRQTRLAISTRDDHGGNNERRTKWEGGRGECFVWLPTNVKRPVHRRRS